MLSYIHCTCPFGFQRFVHRTKEARGITVNFGWTLQIQWNMYSQGFPFHSRCCPVVAAVFRHGIWTAWACFGKAKGWNRSFCSQKIQGLHRCFCKASSLWHTPERGERWRGGDSARHRGHRHLGWTLLFWGTSRPPGSLCSGKVCFVQA